MKPFLVFITLLCTMIYSCGNETSSDSSNDSGSKVSSSQSNSERINCLKSGMFKVWDKSKLECISTSRLWFDGSMKHFTSVNSLSVWEFNQIHNQVLFELDIERRFPNDVIKKANLILKIAKIETGSGYEYDIDLKNISDKNLIISTLKNFYLTSL